MTSRRQKASVVLRTILFVLSVIWWLWRKPITPSTSEAVVSSDAAAESSNQPPERIVAPKHEAEPSKEKRPKQPIGQDRVQALRSDPDFDWKTPIEFYGKVVDERSTPVPEASVTFLWTDLSTEGSSQRKTLSDERGMFSLKSGRGSRRKIP
jgi:hypothetical protein